MLEETKQFCLEPVYANIVTKTVMPRHWRTRLVRVKFPGMKIEHHRFSLFLIDSVDPFAEPGFWEKAKIATTANRKIRSEPASCSYGKFDQFLCSIVSNVIRKARSSYTTVAIMEDRIDARIIEKAFLQEDIVGPRLILADRIVRSTIPYHCFPREIFKNRLCTSYILTKLLGILTRDELMPIAMTCNLVGGLINLLHHSRMR